MMNMPRRTRIACALALVINLLTFSSYAQQSYNVTMINHFDKLMSFSISTNPDVLPDIPANFTLAVDEQAGTRVLDLNKEVYIHGQDDNKHSAFFGIDIVNNAVKIHGYISKGIAFSWKANTIIFCTPEKYKENKSCF